MLLILVENSNHVRLAQKISEEIVKVSSAKINILYFRDALSPTVQWVEQALEAFKNQAFGVIPVALGEQSLFLGEDSFSKAFCSQILKSGWPQGELILAVFTDASVRGLSSLNGAKKLGMETVLIQDGWVEFRRGAPGATKEVLGSKGSWGRGAARHAFVWTESAAQQLDLKTGLETQATTVGPLSFNLAGSAIRRRQEQDFSSVTFIDQPVSDQGILPLDRWLVLLERLFSGLREYKLLIAIHPSSSPVAKQSIEALAQRHHADLAGEPFCEGIAISFFSTVIFERLMANLPTVALTGSGSLPEFPPYFHPRLAFGTLEGDRIDLEQLFSNSSIAVKAKRLTSVNRADEAFEKIAIKLAQMAAGLKKSNQVNLPLNFAQLDKPFLALTTSLRTDIGVSKSILAIQQVAGQQVSVVKKDWPINWGNVPSAFSGVILNGLGLVLNLGLRELNALRKVSHSGIPVAWYVHESWSIVGRIFRQRPLRLLFVLFSQNRFLFMAVSSEHQGELRKIGIQKPFLVPEARIPTDPREKNHSQATPVVLMVGSKQQRKGVSLFSQVADIARREGRGWKFVWVGPPTKLCGGCYFSDNVEWRTAESEDELSKTYRSASVFLLSSRDDASPHVVLEAVEAGLPIVLFKGVGNAGLIDEFGLGVVSRRLAAADFYIALSEAMKCEPNQDHRKQFLERFRAERVWAHLNSLIAEGRLCECPKKIKFTAREGFSQSGTGDSALGRGSTK